MEKKINSKNCRSYSTFPCILLKLNCGLWPQKRSLVPKCGHIGNKHVINIQKSVRYKLSIAHHFWIHPNNVVSISICYSIICNNKKIRLFNWWGGLIHYLLTPHSFFGWERPPPSSSYSWAELALFSLYYSIATVTSSIATVKSSLATVTSSIATVTYNIAIVTSSIATVTSSIV